MAAEDRLSGAIRALVNGLNELPAPSMIIGGVAVIAAGVPRQTIDVDAAVLGRATDPESVITALARHGIKPRIRNAVQFARERQVLLLQHESGVTMEVSFAWLPFEEEALSKALEVDVGGITVRMARPEDLIVYKVAAWRDRDRSDVERLLALYLDTIDMDRVRALIAEIAMALDEPSRIDEFDTMVRRIRGFA